MLQGGARNRSEAQIASPPVFGWGYSQKSSESAADNAKLRRNGHSSQTDTICGVADEGCTPRAQRSAGAPEFAPVGACRIKGDF